MRQKGSFIEILPHQKKLYFQEEDEENVKLVSTSIHIDFTFKGMHKISKIFFLNAYAYEDL